MDIAPADTREPDVSSDPAPVPAPSSSPAAPSAPVSRFADEDDHDPKPVKPWSSDGFAEAISAEAFLLSS